MDYSKMKEFYEICKEMTNNDVFELVTETESQEEKDFYTAVFEFFLQNRQKEIINEPFSM